MSFSYAGGTNPTIDYVRLLIADTNPTNNVFEDSEIMAAYAIQQSIFQSGQFYSYPSGAYLPTSPVSYLRVAALLLESLAANNSRLIAITQILDVKLDPSKAAIWLRDQAKAYRDVDDNSGAFMVIEQCNNDWSFKQRWWNQMQRQAL